MDPQDAFLVLKSAQHWTAFTQHSFFLLIRDPYTNVSEVTSVLTQDVYISDVLGSVFLLYPTVPNVIYTTGSGATFLPHVWTKSMAALEDAFVTVFQGRSSLYPQTISNIDGLTLSSAMKVVNSDLSGREISFDSISCDRNLEFALYDYRIADSDFSVARYIWQGCGSSWCSKVFRSIEWPQGVTLPGDECFLRFNCSPVGSGKF